MSDAPDSVLNLLQKRLRELELDAVMIRGRVEELQTAIATLEEHGPRRPGRPRKADIIEMPDRVDSGTHQPEEGTAA